MQRIGAEAQNIGDVQALMDAFCPMHVILDASGHIVHVGATLQKLRASLPLEGRRFFGRV